MKDTEQNGNRETSTLTKCINLETLDIPHILNYVQPEYLILPR